MCIKTPGAHTVCTQTVHVYYTHSIPHSHAHTELTAVERSFNALMFPFYDSHSLCSLCVNLPVLYKLSPELELESAKMASEKVTELLFQTLQAPSRMADMGTKLTFYGNALENAGMV